MKTAYSDMDIRFTMDGYSIHAPNIIFERFTRTIPSHSHGNGCYEIHYIPQGYGKLTADKAYYDITPNTLFVTGPHVEHAQSPLLTDPMQEYCIYLKIRKAASSRTASLLMDTFLSRPFWFGKDQHNIHPVIKQLFDELKCQHTGYMKQIGLLLSQLLIALVRNYEQSRNTPGHYIPSNLTDRTSVIIEEYFLYEYSSLSLEVLADRLKLSPRQTQRLLQNYYGKTFQQKKADAKMSAAAILLKDGDRSITSLADELGYSSPEHFSGAFRRYYGMSPREFRKMKN